LSRYRSKCFGAANDSSMSAIRKRKIISVHGHEMHHFLFFCNYWDAAMANIRFFFGLHLEESFSLHHLVLMI